MTPEDRAARVRLLLFDVDGVMTDGSVFLDDRGHESKRFHIRDGAALVFAQRTGLLTGLMSARASESTLLRAAQLGMHIVHQGVASKLATYESILRDRGLADEEVAYMGDDLVDLAVLARVGLAAAPCDAAHDVRERVHWISGSPGGRGAVRELVELVLRSQGRWQDVIDGHLETRR